MHGRTEMLIRGEDSHLPQDVFVSLGDVASLVVNLSYEDRMAVDFLPVLYFSQ